LLAPVALLPLGVIVLARARETVTWVGGAGMLGVGAGWAYWLWGFAGCEDPAPCGGPGWLEALFGTAFLLGLPAVLGAGLVLFARRFRRGRHTPAQ